MIPTKLLLSYPTLLLAVLLFPSCKDNSVQQTSSTVVFPSSNVSYGKQVEPLFLQVCAFPGCHGADTFDQNGFSLDTYDHLMFGTVKVVYARDTLNSPLVWSIEGRSGVARMPLSLTPLNSNQINGIKKWILENAQDN